MMSNRRNEFDHSMMSCYTNCRRKYEYHINRGLVKNRKATAPSFGQGIHSALDMLYKSEFEDIEGAILAFKEEYKEDVKLDSKRTWEVGEWIIRNYVLTYRDQPFKVLAVEQAFEVPLENGNTFIGRIDKIIEWDGVVWVLDHKTTSMLGSNYGKMIEPNGQFTGYVYAARKLGYEKCCGVIVDAMLVAKGLLASSSRGRLTPFARFDAHRSDKMIEEWLEQAVTIQYEIWKSEDKVDWPMDGLFNGLCTYYGECEFRQVCLEESDLREKVISMDYKVDRWDPRDKGKG